MSVLPAWLWDDVGCVCKPWDWHIKISRWGASYVGDAVYLRWASNKTEGSTVVHALFTEGTVTLWRSSIDGFILVESDRVGHVICMLGLYVDM